MASGERELDPTTTSTTALRHSEETSGPAPTTGTLGQHLGGHLALVEDAATMAATLVAVLTSMTTALQVPSAYQTSIVGPGPSVVLLLT